MKTLDDQQLCNSSVIIRVPFSSDQLECQKMIRRSSDEILSHITFVFLSKLSWYVVITTVFSAAAATLWSLWIFVLYIIVFAVVVVHPYFKWRSMFKHWQNSVLQAEIRDGVSCHTWVAEWNSKFVGMVRLCHIDPCTAELKHMFVLPSCRGMGISNKLLGELIRYAKRERLKKVVLFVSSAQTPAVQLYKKHGFKVVSTERPFSINMLLFQRLNLELQLWGRYWGALWWMPSPPTGRSQLGQVIVTLLNWVRLFENNSVCNAQQIPPWLFRRENFHLLLGKIFNKLFTALGLPCAGKSNSTLTAKVTISYDLSYCDQT